MSGNFLPLLADRVLNRPLLIHPDKAVTILNVLEGRITLGSSGDAPTAPEASRFVGHRRRPDGKGRLVRAEGPTALVTIDGSLVNRGAWLEVQSGLTSYEGIAAQISDAAADPTIENIVLDINSYGGEATGMAALAALIRKAGRNKRVVAVVNDVAASAGYGLASAAHAIVISPTSLVGSIGVLLVHLDRSAEVEKKGIKPTLIHAGAHKVDGNPFEPLPDAVRADLQREVEIFHEQFLATVAAGRGRRLTGAAARATEARTFIGSDAIRAGLADQLGTLEEVLTELARPRPGGKSPTRKKGNPTMFENHDTAAIARAERARCKSIVTLPEAKGRESSAMAFAFDSDMAPEAARAALAGIPAAADAVPRTPPIGQRDSGLEIGANRPVGAAPEAAKAGWGKAIATANGPLANDPHAITSASLTAR